VSEAIIGTIAEVVAVSALLALAFRGVTRVLHDGWND
jgi:hypothetical protein